MDAIKGIVGALQQGGVFIPGLLLQLYARLGLLENEVMVIVHLLYARDGERIDLPTPQWLAARMSIPESRVLASIERLVREGFLSIEMIEDGGIVGEKYDFGALYTKLAQMATSTPPHDAAPPREPTSQRRRNIFTLFESEFARPLSPLEYDTIIGWIDRDGCSDSLIMAALKEAVFSGKLSFRHVDRILNDWMRQGIMPET